MLFPALAWLNWMQKTQHTSDKKYLSTHSFILNEKLWLSNFLYFSFFESQGVKKGCLDIKKNHPWFILKRIILKPRNSNFFALFLMEVPLSISSIIYFSTTTKILDLRCSNYIYNDTSGRSVSHYKNSSSSLFLGHILWFIK